MADREYRTVAVLVKQVYDSTGVKDISSITLEFVLLLIFSPA
jgi:hypothetical protein